MKILGMLFFLSLFFWHITLPAQEIGPSLYYSEAAWENEIPNFSFKSIEILRFDLEDSKEVYSEGFRIYFLNGLMNKTEFYSQPAVLEGVTNYEYDDSNRVTNISTKTNGIIKFAKTIEYKPTVTLEKTMDGNGSVLDIMEYQSTGNHLEIRTFNEESILREILELEYSPDKRVKSFKKMNSSGFELLIRTYSFDKDHRLVEVKELNVAKGTFERVLYKYNLDNTLSQKLYYNGSKITKKSVFEYPIGAFNFVENEYLAENDGADFLLTKKFYYRYID